MSFKASKLSHQQATKLKTLPRPRMKGTKEWFLQHKDKSNFLLLGEAGLEPLLNLCNHENPKIRSLAEESVSGLKKVEGDILMSSKGLRNLSDILRFKVLQAQSDTLMTLAILAGNTDQNHEGIILDIGWQVILIRAKALHYEIQRAAVTLIANLALNEDNHDMILNEGGLEQMKSLVNSNDIKLKRAICNAFTNLATDEENVQAILKDGGLRVIFDFALSDDDELICGAAHCLANLAIAEELKSTIVKEGGLPILVKLLKSYNVMILKGATTAVANLSSSDENLTKLMDSGLLEPLVFLGRKSKNPDVLFRVALTFNNLCSVEKFHERIKAGGAVNSLKVLAKSRDEDVKREAIEALTDLGVSISHKKGGASDEDESESSTAGTKSRKKRREEERERPRDEGKEREREREEKDKEKEALLVSLEKEAREANQKLAAEREARLALEQFLLNRSLEDRSAAIARAGADPTALTLTGGGSGAAPAGSVSSSTRPVNPSPVPNPSPAPASLSTIGDAEKPQIGSASSASQTQFGLSTTTPYEVEDQEEDDQVTDEDKLEKANIALVMVDLWDPKEDEIIERALTRLNSLAQKERNRKWIRTAGAIPILIKFLEKVNPEKGLTKCEFLSLITLATLSRNVLNRDDIRKSEGLLIFMKLLVLKDPKLLVEDLKAIKELSKSSLNARTFRDEKLIEIILPMAVAYLSDSDQSKTNNYNFESALTIIDIIHIITLDNPLSQAIVRESKGVQFLINCLNNPSVEVRKHSIRALGSVSANNRKIQQMIRKGKVFNRVVQMLSDDDEDLRKFTAGGCGAICENDQDNQLAFRKLGGIPPLVKMLNSSNNLVKEQATAAIRSLTKGNAKIQNDLRDTSCITLLINNMSSDNDALRVHSVGALMELARDNPRNQELICAAGVIPPLVTALKSDYKVLQYLAAGAVWALAKKNCMFVLCLFKRWLTINWSSS
eukprot:TRINITY_DN2317_c0_g1_i2.p1 TRINITY_DN2317_c0_g1~~TRINITY_DN2317_c0_g1_i2.p1  ORF type:complete len:959 (+),score=189.10 TRINITY_DN2317_c0_g1_i2:36-2912(+)